MRDDLAVGGCWDRGDEGGREGREDARKASLKYVPKRQGRGIFFLAICFEKHNWQLCSAL